MAFAVLAALLCVLFPALALEYDTGSGPVEGKLNVHLVAHSHDDVGWLKTIDQYYVGSNNSIQNACVRNVLDSVVDALVKDRNRKFIFVEQAFFQRWWAEQNNNTQEIVRKLLGSGQLEFINGGWCMHDEATAHYIDMIDQTTLGHLLIKKQFGIVPHVGWQIDPFGHSAVQAYLLGAELGFDSMHFARIDYQDRAKRKVDKSLEVIWRGSKTFGSSSEIFTNVFPINYSPPNGFHFEVGDKETLIQDNHLLFDYNVQQRVNDFVEAAKAQANYTRTNHIMWTMGDDFQYQYAESWFRQMDRFIHYVNKDGRVNALYSTPSIYVDVKNAAEESWPLKTNDYFPYADNANAYWTGYFTSRPALKRYVRILSGYYLAARQLEFLSGKRNSGQSTFSLGDSLGIAQHHDALTGTAKQHTTDDYAKRLAIGYSEAEAVVNLALSHLIKSRSKETSMLTAAKFSQCPLINISYCDASEKGVSNGKSLVVVAYNSLGWLRNDIIRIPVNNNNYAVRDSHGKKLDIQYVPVDDVTTNLRNLYTKAYLGFSSKKSPRFWLIFEVSVPPLGWNTYFISKTNARGVAVSNAYSTSASSHNGMIEVGAGPLKMSFSATSGLLKQMTDRKTGVHIPITQEYMWYLSSPGDEDPQASGAYIFRPDGSPIAASKMAPLKIYKGALVDEVHQQFSPWIHQVIRLYKGKGHAEFEFTIGPIPTDDNTGKEVITRFSSNMATNGTFYTDSSGRDFLKRVRDFREDWTLQVNQPVSGNYYPLNLGIFLADGKSELSVLVDRSTGGASIYDGEVELMLHRRTIYDDSRGVGEALDERVCVNDDCQGLIVRGNYHVGIHQLGSGSQWRRTNGQQMYSPLLLAFAHEDENIWKASQEGRGTFMDSTYSLPPNVAIITLQELDDGEVLLRLVHLYEAGEDPKHSTLAKVELKRIFGKKMIREVKEMSLSGNQEKTKMRKKLKWRVEGGSNDIDHKPLRGAPVDNAALVVELGPMEIRTFFLKF